MVLVVAVLVVAVLVALVVPVLELSPLLQVQPIMFSLVARVQVLLVVMVVVEEAVPPVLIRVHVVVA